MLFYMAAHGKSHAGFVLAGGRSSRMGADKAFLEIDGQTLLERTLAVMRAVCEAVTIVGDPARFQELKTSQPTPVVADIFPGCGPLGGIHAALAFSKAELNLMLAVDMPFVSSDLLAFLLETAQKNDALVTVPRIGDRFQPLCAVYRRAFSGVAESTLRTGKYKIESAFSGISVQVVDEGQLGACGFLERSFFNLNTPSDRVIAEGRFP